MRNARKSLQPAESPFVGCPPELLARIFAALDVKERCRVVPLLSKQMQKIHKDFLPQPEEWTFGRRDRISASVVKWFQLIAGSVKLLSIASEDDFEAARKRETSFLPQLLCTAAASAPNLHKLVVGDLANRKVVMPAMYSLGLLSQVKDVYLRCWDLKGAEQLSGLHSLQVLTLDVQMWEAVEEDVGALWAALTPLKSLTQLSFAVWDLRGVDFYASISLLTRLRELSVCGDHSSCLDRHRAFHASFRALSGVTKLECMVPNNALHSIPSLSLTHLEVSLQNYLQGGRLSPSTPETLTSLVLEFGTFKMEDMFAQAMGVLPRLRHLQINFMIGSFPDFAISVATSLRNLKLLALRHNRMRRLPKEISLITSLQELDVSRNRISLEVGDVSTLSMLWNLRVLRLEGNDPHLGEGSLAGSGDHASVLDNIACKFPDLDLRL